MKSAPLYAGVAFNLLFFEFLFESAPNLAPAQLWLVTLFCGFFLAYGIGLAPARAGLGPRELVERQFGPAAAGFFWWIVLPVWAIGLFQFHAQVFGNLAHTPVVRDPTWFLLSDDDRLAGYWAWMALTALAAVQPWADLPRSSRVLALLSAGILLSAPFAFSPPLPQSLFASPYCCANPFPLESAILLWFTPVLLLAGSWGASPQAAWRTGLLLAAILSLSVAVVTITFHQAAWEHNPLLKVGSYLRLALTATYARVLLASLSLLVTGRLCLSLLAQHLGSYRRWWTVLPLALLLVWMPIDLSPFWPHAAAFCLPLAGVLAAARNQAIPHRPAAYLAYLAGLTVSVVSFLLAGGGYNRIYTAPFLSWLTAFLVFTAAKNRRFSTAVSCGP